MSCRAIALSILLLAAAVPAAAQQRTPAAPPAPDCNVSLKGEGKWVKGDIIHPKDPSMGTPCTQTYTCTGDPPKKPNEACNFSVQHTKEAKSAGQCDDKSCKNCTGPPKDKCEWSLVKR
jgi:hypothetical protein